MEKCALPTPGNAILGIGLRSGTFINVKKTASKSGEEVSDFIELIEKSAFGNIS